MNKSFNNSRLRRVITAGLVFLSTPWAGAQEWLYSFDASGNALVRSLGAGVAPQILALPQRQIVAPGELASFSVVVADPTGAAVQWYFNGSIIEGATGDTLLLNNVGLANEGQYAVVVANSFGSVTSAPAPLMIDSLGRGIPDSWQAAYFGGFVQNPAGDFDGDGVSNLDEFLEGTDPTDLRSFNPRLQIQAAIHGQVAASPSLPYYAMGQYVTLTALPDPGSTFQGWSGAVRGLKSQISVLMNGHKSVSASFSPAVAPPVFKSVNLANGNVGLTWTSVQGRSYQLQYTSDLQWGTWINLGGTNIAIASTITIYDLIGADPQRFYRVNLLP